MKYDCTKTLDYMHELNRLCDDQYPKGCAKVCPLAYGCNNKGDFKPDYVDIVQKWSDSHPEKPKLTKEEYDFLASFMYPEELSIRKGGFTMQLDTAYAVGYPDATIPLRKDMFHFIEDKVWSVTDLLKLEVKE